MHPQLLAVPLLLLPLVLCAPNTVVPFWTDDAGYCKQLEGYDKGVHRPNGLVPIDLQLGQTLTFKFSTHHDVWLHPTQASFDSCDFNTAKLLANTDQGGNCTEDNDLICIDGKTGYVYTPTAAGTYWFTCSVHDHCINGQKLVVTVTPHGEKESGDSEVSSSPKVSSGFGGGTIFLASLLSLITGIAIGAFMVPKLLGKNKYVEFKGHSSQELEQQMQNN